MFSGIRNNWSREEIAEIYHKPLLELIYQAATIHREYYALHDNVCPVAAIHFYCFVEYRNRLLSFYV